MSDISRAISKYLPKCLSDLVEEYENQHTIRYGEIMRILSFCDKVYKDNSNLLNLVLRRMGGRIKPDCDNLINREICTYYEMREKIKLATAMGLYTMNSGVYNSFNPRRNYNLIYLPSRGY